MENICAEALTTGPAEGRLKMKEVLIKSVYKIAGYYPEFYRSVFKEETSFTICMLADPNEKVWPICIPAGLFSSAEYPSGSVRDSWGFPYIALTPILVELDIGEIIKDGKSLTFREATIFLIFVQWLTGERLDKNKLLLTSSYLNKRQVGVHWDADGSLQVTDSISDFAFNGYLPCLRKELSKK
jgi:hypothetical protein